MIAYRLLSSIIMSEEYQIQSQGPAKWHPQKDVLIHMNEHVVRLIKEKLIPLNKLRYLHLQKISKALNKKPGNVYSSAINLTLYAGENKQSSEKLSPLCKVKTSRNKQYKMITADLLINRLKNLKDLQLNSGVMCRDQKAGRCWETLRNSILQTQQIEIKKTKSPDYLESDSYRTSRGKRRKENLMELAERAEKYLRFKKHQLKQRYCQQEQQRQSKRRQQAKQSQIQLLLSKFKTNTKGSSRLKVGTDEQMEKELLRDIRQNMLQQKINRIKKDINHKKIVQLR